MTIPCINKNSAITIISKIVVDILQISNPYHLSTWARLDPVCNEYASKKKSVKISHAIVYLKPYLVESAHCTARDKSKAYYADKFNKNSKHRSKKQTYIAIARKILVDIYQMLSTGGVCYSTDLASVETSDKDRIKYTKNNFCRFLKQLLFLVLTSNGLINLID